jgi:hypothetical protein
MNKIEPTKITLEYYNKKISTEVESFRCNFSGTT